MAQQLDKTMQKSLEKALEQAFDKTLDKALDKALKRVLPEILSELRLDDDTKLEKPKKKNKYKGSYLAIELNEESEQELRKTEEYQLLKKQCGGWEENTHFHLTLVYNNGKLNEKGMGMWNDLMECKDATVEFDVVYLGFTDVNAGFFCDNLPVPCLNKYPHLTVMKQKGVSAVETGKIPDLGHTKCPMSIRVKGKLVHSRKRAKTRLVPYPVHGSYQVKSNVA